MRLNWRDAPTPAIRRIGFQLRAEQHATGSDAQPGKFTLVMLKKIMRPDRLCSATAVVRHPLSNGLVGAEACLPECLRFTQSPKNENPIDQIFGNRGLH